MFFQNTEEQQFKKRMFEVVKNHREKFENEGDLLSKKIKEFDDKFSYELNSIEFYFDICVSEGVGNTEKIDSIRKTLSSWEICVRQVFRNVDSISLNYSVSGGNLDCFSSAYLKMSKLSIDLIDKIKKNQDLSDGLKDFYAIVLCDYMRDKINELEIQSTPPATSMGMFWHS